jgi:CRISPR-associated protein Cst2
MAHLSGLLLIDCPASALNNAGQFIEMERPNRYENWTAIKKMRTKEGIFPYVSGQAFRSWLRESLKSVDGWTSSPVFREEKIAYTDADPITYAEDDLFGYMRAPGATGTEKVKATRQRWKEQGLSDQQARKEGEKEKFAALTRISPFKVSTLISLSPLNSASVGYDYGNMARTEDPEYPNPVPYEHEFYRTTLMGLLSVDLRMLGRFYHIERTGYRHLDVGRKKLAEEKGLRPYDNGRAFDLGLPERKKRLAQLLNGLAQITGGAKLSLHYTDVSPRLLMLAVAKGGNHLFGTAVGANKQGLPNINTKALKQIATVYKESLLSGFHVGLVEGYLDEQRAALAETLKEISGAVGEKEHEIPHPIQAINNLLTELEARAEDWLA